MGRGNPRARAEADRFAATLWSGHIRELYERGESHQAIAQELNRRKVRTFKGRTWHRQTVTRLIERISKRDAIPDGPRRPVREPRSPEQLLRAAMAGDSSARRSILELLGVEPDRDTAPGPSELSTRLRAAVRSCGAREPWNRDALLHEAAAQGPCAQVQTLGIAAQSDRMSGDFAAAEELLRTAENLAGACASCHADLDRRWAHFFMARGWHLTALRKAEESLRRYQALGHPGHDLYGAGLEEALLARGQARWYLGRHEESARDFERCLEALDPDEHDDLYHGVLVSLGVALKECGQRGQEEAVGVLRGVRKTRFMRRDRRNSAHLARLNCLEGSLKYKLRMGPPCRARAMVRIGLELFLLRDMPEDGVATLADLARMVAPRRGVEPSRIRIEELLEDYGPPLATLGVSEATETALAGLKAACGLWSWDGRELTSAIRTLRSSVASTRVLPCLL